MYNLGLALLYQRKYAEAQALWSTVLGAKQELLVSDHADIVQLYQHLQTALRAQESWSFRVNLFLRGLWRVADPPASCPLLHDCPTELTTRDQKVFETVSFLCVSDIDKR